MSVQPAAPGTAQAASPELDFEVVGARALRYSAAPALAIDLQISEPEGRPVYMIALSIQLMIEPARRTYDEATRERLVELFGAPERWGATTHNLVWSRLDVLVPAFTGTTTVSVPVPCSLELELAAAKYLYSLPDGVAPLAMHFNGMVYYPGADGALQIVLVPWNKSIDFRMPVAVWRETVEHYYQGTAWVGVRAATAEALQREKLRRGLPTIDACIEALLEGGG
ncbi:MAG: DUF6084 family protein [Solirubrobacteraceae bacterium]